MDNNNSNEEKEQEATPSPETEKSTQGSAFSPNTGVTPLPDFNYVRKVSDDEWDSIKAGTHPTIMITGETVRLV